MLPGLTRILCVPKPDSRAAVPLVPDQVRHVLIQRAAAADVQHLHAPADGQQRHPEPQRAAGDREIPRVAYRHGRLRLRVPRRAVPDRVDVRAARHDQPVYPRDRGAGLLVGPAGRQQHRPPPAGPYRVNVEYGSIAARVVQLRQLASSS